MKKILKIISLLLSLAVLALSIAACGTNDIVDNTPEAVDSTVIEVGGSPSTEGTIDGGSSDESSGESTTSKTMMKLVIGGTQEVVYSVDYSAISLDKGVLSIIEYLAENYGLEYEIEGTFLTKVGAMEQDLSTATYVYLWTNVEADFDVSIYAPENKTWNGISLTPSGVGISEMTVENGAVIYVGTVSYG